MPAARDDLKHELVRSAPTSRDVARIAGVSHSAVSRAFTEGASISPRMRAKVIEAANALGYRPNLLARSLTTGRSKLIGVAAANLENNFVSHALELLCARLTDAGYQLLVHTAYRDSDVKESQLEELLRYKLHGMVLLTMRLPDKLAECCTREGVPIVYFNRPVSPTGLGFSVQAPNEEGGRQIARFLVEGGFRRLAFMAGHPDAYSSRQREAGFTDELARLGASPPIREIGDFVVATAMTAARRLLARPDRCDAIFCANDQMALASIAVAQSEFGLKVGKDLAVVGFGDVPMASWPNYALTTYAMPLAAMADEAVAFLLNERSPVSERRQVILPGKLIVRESAPARRDVR